MFVYSYLASGLGKTSLIAVTHTNEINEVRIDMPAIKKFLVEIKFEEKKQERRQITIFAPDNIPEDDICNMAEAQLLEQFTQSYKETIELTDAKILKPLK